MSKIFLLNYDNGVMYDDNQTYAIGVFDDYQKAVDFILRKGFKQSEVRDIYKRGEPRLVCMEETITISEIKMNVELDFWGDICEEDMKIWEKVNLINGMQ